MMVGSDYHTEALRTYNPKLDYAVAPLPVAPGGRKMATEFSVNIYFVPVGSKHPLEAVKFAMWAGNGVAVIGNENIWHTFSGYKQGPDSPKNIWQQRGDPVYKVTEQLLHVAQCNERSAAADLRSVEQRYGHGNPVRLLWQVHGFGRADRCAEPHAAAPGQGA